jgi:hypothetical protein
MGALSSSNQSSRADNQGICTPLSNTTKLYATSLMDVNLPLPLWGRFA